MSRILIAFILFGLITSAVPAYGQQAEQPATQAEKIVSPEKQISDQLANWRGQLQSAEQALSRDGLRDEELAANASEASAIRLKALDLENRLATNFVALKDQLDQLGPPPKEDEPAESEIIDAQRKQLGAEFSTIDGHIKEAQLIALRARQIERIIIESRRQRFVRGLTTHSKSVFDLTLWQQWVTGFDGFGKRFSLLISESSTSFTTRLQERPGRIIGLLAMIVALGVAIGIANRITVRKLRRLGHAHGDGEQAADQRARHAGLQFIKTGLIPALVFLGLYGCLKFMGLLTDRFDNLLSDIALVAALATLGIALARTFLAPMNEANRIAKLTDDIAKSATNLVTFIVLAVAFLWVLNRVALALVSPFEVSIGLSAILALVVFLGTVRMQMLVASDPNAGQPIRHDRRNLIRWGYINPVLWLAICTGLLALASGYVAFAEFLALQILLLGLIVTILWLVVELFDRHRTRFLNEKRGGWKHFSRTTGFSKQTVMQTAVFGFGLLKLLTVFTAFLLFMISWGYRTGDWSGIISEAFFGFKIGGLTISVSSIFLAVLLFVVGYTITRAIQHWLQIQFLPTTNMDTGLRNSIATVFGYAGIVLAALLAITAAGLDLSKVAIVAGALSVGIGFGLQSIVNNFVSGLILLAERPIKIGDWIVTGGGQGTVRKTSVRSTEIETFDGATVIVPNSTLITDPVTNWTHHDPNGRIIIAIGVGYDSDPDQVRDILLACSKDNGMICEDPAARVFFQDFGSDALVFELRAYLDDINFGMSVKSDLRFAILRELRKANIEIPYPQRDLHIKSAPEELMGGVNKSRTAKPKHPTKRPGRARKGPDPVAQEIE